MVHHIDAQHSNFTTTGDAFGSSGPDTLLVDADAFLITTDSIGIGANLSGSWNVTINGAVNTLGNANRGLPFVRDRAREETGCADQMGDCGKAEVSCVKHRL
ncbi:MAG TPA: hypothetical protein VIG26_02160 [Methyloceanibacter sp.]